MILTTDVLILIVQMAIKYGPEVTQAFAKLFKGGASLDDAIAALELAKTKTAEQYRDEAKANLAAVQAAAALVAATPVVNMPIDPSKDVVVPVP
jgi:hypothetical protein